MLTLIFPIIDYGGMFYYDLNADLLNKYDCLLNKYIRFIFKVHSIYLRKYDHISSYRSELKWLPVCLRRRLRAHTTFFSLPNSLSPPTRPRVFNTYTLLERILRSSHNVLFLCRTHTSGFVNSSFVVQTVLLWNDLPLIITHQDGHLSVRI